METYGSLDDFTHRTDSVVSLGMFDGLHLAHREVLRALTDRARATGSRSVVITSRRIREPCSPENPSR